eukprot:7739427-Pyramimonas_sp.AAC.1
MEDWSQLVHSNIHNYELPRDDEELLAELIVADLGEAHANPARPLALVSGDFNFARVPPRKELDAEVDEAPHRYLQDWRSSQDRSLMEVLGKMVEIEVPEPSHHFAPKRMLTYIDRQFVSLP